MDEPGEREIHELQSEFIIIDELEWLVPLEKKKENLFKSMAPTPEKKTTTKYFGTLYSGLKKKIVLKSEEGLSEAKKYLKEAMSTRGAETPQRRVKMASILRDNKRLNLEDE